MKKFDSILDAINFRTQCPVCQSKLQIDDRKSVNSSKKLVFEILGYHNYIYVDLITQQIELILDDNNKSKKHGILGHPLTIGCETCNMYSFVIQLWIDLDNKSINDIFLNSESFSWEDEEETLHEIISSYATNKTKYNYFKTDQYASDGQIVLPLVFIDMNNPKETIDRIKKLLIFL